MRQQRLKILVISMGENRDDRGSWSGTVFQAIKGLERAGYDVDYLWALRDCQQTFLDKLLCNYWMRVPHWFGKNSRCDEAFYTYRLFRQTLKHFDYSPYDIIFVPTHVAIMCALPRHIKAKVVHLVDATVDSLFDYYTEFSNLLWHNYREAHILGKRAFKRADLIIASSDWCKRNAINQYGISPDKITVVEFGANIDAKDIPHQVKHYSAGEPLNIYWSGVNWERKGGEVALECCRELTNLGINVHFHITGMKTLPEEIENLPWVVNHGFLNKNNPSEYQKLIDIISKQHIFLFPSRAECSSIALCEANAFSLPCFAYDTGGTANYITDTVNGRMLPLTASGSDFANAILGTLPNYESMSAAARKKYETSLNWETWSSHVARSINFIVIPKQVL